MTAGEGKPIRAQTAPKLYLDPNLQIMFGVTLMVLMGVLSVMPVLPELTVELGVPARSIGLVVTVFALPGVFLAPVIMGAVLASFGMDAIFWVGAGVAVCMVMVAGWAVE